MRWSELLGAGCLLADGLLVGCAAGPPPIVIYEDAQQYVRLQFDPRAGTGHSHPASLSLDQIATILRGVRVKGNDVIVGFGLLDNKDHGPAFSASQITTLAPYLSQALNKASPVDLATFYLVIRDSTKGPLITSGGVFVRNSHVYIILANTRTSPSTVQYETTYEPSTKDQPLLPLTRFKYTAHFDPPDAQLPTIQTQKADGYPGYLDEAKLIVIDLARLFPRVGTTTEAPRPSP